MKKPLKKPYVVLVYFIVLVLFSISQWEYYFDYYDRIIPMLIAIASSIAVVAIGGVLFVAKKCIKALYVTLLIYLFLISSGLLMFKIQKNENNFITQFEDKTELYRDIGDSIVILDSLRLKDMEVFVLGRYKCDPFLKYKPTELSFGTEDDAALLNIIPQWYLPYTDQISPMFINYKAFQDSSLPIGLRYGYLTRCAVNYFSWQYPEYDFNIIIFYDSPYKVRKIIYPMRSVFHANSYEKKELIILPKPLFQQLIWRQEGILQRLISYKNLILYTFVSPFAKDPVKNKGILKKRTITLADLDSLGLNSNQKELMKEYVR
jgi:hypothetical protein